KPNTNDMRYAPALKMIPELVRLGAKVIVYDPASMEEARSIFGNSIKYAQNVYMALDNSDLALVLTDWTEIVEMDLTKAKRVMRNPILFDGRNCFSIDEMKSKGFDYYSIGRQSVVQSSNSINSIIY